MALANAKPVIIKRKKVVAAGHHGGAWKVAYADFVTAMMAFFLLMWLINVTTEQQRKGLADYFNPTVPISRTAAGGTGVMGGTDPRTEDSAASAGRGASSISPSDERQAVGQTGTDPQQMEELSQEQLESIEEALLARTGESAMREQLLRHIVTRITDEGLIVEIFDLEDAPLFQGETAEPRTITIALAEIIADTFALVRNGVAINGHTRVYPIMIRENPVWHLSSQRAETMRVLLTDHDLEDRRIRRVAGHADRQPAMRNPMSARNNRLEVILLRRSPALGRS
ncbi:flagellar motor protein MotB [Halodurantibacterium flavum]|uniref:Flagellar motor protein MotB n=1 Tax=Halodurantibacterium flavum TaxID=1382802 RepID=A0ABW4S9B2_9RHOB